MNNAELRPIVDDLWQSSAYREAVGFVESLRPVVPAFDYKSNSNIEEIKFKLAQQQAIDLVLSVLKPQQENRK